MHCQFRYDVLNFSLDPNICDKLLEIVENYRWQVVGGPNSHRKTHPNRLMSNGIPVVLMVLNISAALAQHPSTNVHQCMLFSYLVVQTDSLLIPNHLH